MVGILPALNGPDDLTSWRQGRVRRADHEGVDEVRFDHVAADAELVVVFLVATALKDNCVLPAWRVMPTAILHRSSVNPVYTRSC